MTVPIRKRKRRVSYHVAIFRDNSGSCFYETKCNACGRLLPTGDMMRHAKQHFGERDHADLEKERHDDI